MVRKAAKRKGKEKVRESPKKACFSSDSQTYALIQASEAELLFGHPRFVLPTVPVIQEDLRECSLSDSNTAAVLVTSELPGRAPAEEPEAHLESEADLETRDHPQTEPEAHLEFEDDLETGDHPQTEPEAHLETEAEEFLEPVGNT